ncbi:MAG: hypothetical protein AAGH89_19785, partial [Verrucomicrobiota bacterium]
EHDEIWNLLGKSPPRMPSGAFVQNTVREVRRSQASSQSTLNFWSVLFQKPAFIGSFAALVVLLLGIFMIPKATDEGTIAATPSSEVAPIVVSEDEVDILTEELEVLTMVSEFLAVSDPTFLDDEALAELLF